MLFGGFYVKIRTVRYTVSYRLWYLGYSRIGSIMLLFTLAETTGCTKLSLALTGTRLNRVLPHSGQNGRRTEDAALSSELL